MTPRAPRPFMDHVDIRDTSGFYLGYLTYALQRNKLEIKYIDRMPWPEKVVAPGEAVPAVWVKEINIPLTVWTVCRRCSGSVLWTERDRVIVGPDDLNVLLDGRYVVLYNGDPFTEDTRNWVNDFLVQLRRAL